MVNHVITYVYEPGSYAPLARLDSHGTIVKEPEPEEIDPVKIEMERRHQEAVALLKRQQEEAYRKAGVEPPKPKEPKICEVYYFHNDASGLPEELSNDRGQLVWRATYKTWGSTRAEGWGYATLSGERVYDQDRGAIPDEPIREQNLRFQGQYLDRGTGLHYNTFRYYDPDIGRFISPDPIGLAGGINLGSYAPNPVSWIDPWGWSCGAPKRKSYEQARNEVLEWLSKRGFKAEKVNFGKFGSIKDKPVGMTTADGKTGFRIEYDDKNQAHINAFSGKEKMDHVLFDASELTVTKIQNQFNLPSKM